MSLVGRDERASPPRGPETRSRRSSNLVIGVLASTGIVVSLQSSIVIPLLPELPQLLKTDSSSASWLVTATLLSGAVATPILSRLADMFGKKRMILVALGAMVIGSAVGAVGEDLGLLILARALEGVGMAAIPVGIAMMRDELPKEKVPLGIALMSATMAIGAGVGLPVCGLIVEHLDWHSIFWLTGAASLLTFAVVARVLEESPIRTGGVFDIKGAALLSAALSAALIALSKGSHWGWLSGRTLGLVVFACIMFAVWVPLELRVRNPVVDVRTAACRPVLLVNAIAFFSGFAMYINMLVSTQLLQLPEDSGFGFGLSVQEAGLMMAPNALAFGLLAPVSAWMMRRWNPRITLTVGTGLMSVVYAVRMVASEEIWLVVLGSILVAGSTSIAYAAMPALIMRLVPATESAAANGLNTLMRSIGTSASSATAAAAASLGVTHAVGNYPTFGSLIALFGLSALLAGAACLLSIPLYRLVRDSEEQSDLVRVANGALVRGQVISSGGRPVQNAVATVLDAEGTQVDWAQVDSTGEVAASVAGPGRYLLVVAAEGWTPRSLWIVLVDETHVGSVVLPERLMVSGAVIRPDRGPAEDALVVVTLLTGDAVYSIRTASDGTFELPLPPNGRYVVTASAGQSTASVALDVWGGTKFLELHVGGSRPVAAHP
ncbi:MFS transporter [Nocardioides immobilis]|uniref:MFS transporter n=1 Tax=Nocardioides immobilis TaxID=2049295 RepID=A0A417XTX9_9ACTN|nr:MFS transporter [Nocardioides immobilis]RHW23677.1 MFS transporter [Nocardioides immobilis]